MSRFRQVVKTILLPVMPIVYLVRDQRPMGRPINLIKTLYVNFRALPFNQAKHFPIYVYKNVKIYKLGKICIESENLKSGMITIGKADYTAQGFGKFFNGGKIVFRGPVELGGGFILDNIGLMIFHGYNKLGPGITFIIRERLEIGRYTTMGFCCFCMDSDDHYTINVDTLMVGRNKKPIIIGSRNWIANRTFIKKGAVTPDFTIVASGNSLLSKDYSDMGPYCVLGGIPAKKIGSNIRRIYNLKEQARIENYFISNPDRNVLSPDVTPENIDDYCTSNYFQD